jgi:serine/threonine-protein kinase PknG
VLSLDLTGFTTTYRHSLPTTADAPLLAGHESYHRALLRATHQDPELRFASAEQMTDQLRGVLREVLAAADGEPRPDLSTLFGPPLRVAGASLNRPGNREVAAALPVPQVDRADPAARFLAGLASAGYAELAAALDTAPIDSLEVNLRNAWAAIMLGDLDMANRWLDDIEQRGDADWRTFWYRALAALVTGNLEEARDRFDKVYDALPGEAAPKVALAGCAELAGDWPTAARYYETVWRTDRGYVGAAFGLARARLALGERAAAVRALDQVPATSSHHVDAVVTAIRALLTDRPATDLTADALVSASTRLDSVELDVARREGLAVEILTAAFDWIRAGRPGAGAVPVTVLGRAADEREIRFGLEHSYRELARVTDARTMRVVLVDQANSVRPVTLV